MLYLVIFCGVTNSSPGAFMNDDILTQTPRSTVLVVDDDPDNADMLGFALGHRLPYSFIAVYGYHEAVALAQKLGSQLALVITDLGLAGNHDGAALVAELHKEYPSLPAIAVTGDSRYKNSGVFMDVFTKPADTDKLAQLITQTLEQRAAA